MSTFALREVRPVVAVLVVIAVLLVASVELAELSSGAVAHLGVLALAAAKVAIVVSEYVEVRGAARWLVVGWLAWGAGTFGGLAVLAG